MVAGLSVAVRMLYSVFGPVDSFKLWVEKMNKIFHLCEGFGSFRAVDLIRETARAIIDIVSQYRPVETLVILIDEVVVLETSLMKDFPLSRDPLSVIRSAFLDDKVHPSTNVALLMASLRLSPIGRTGSTRVVSPIVLPDRLDPNKVVDTWLGLGDLTAKETDLLLLLVGSISNLPRALQFVKMNTDYVRRSVPIGSGFIRKIVDITVAGLQTLYEPTFPSARLFYHIIFQEPLFIDEEVAAAIEDSIITNSLTRFKIAKAWLVPQSSPLMLMAAESTEDFSYQQDILRSVIETLLTTPTQEGDTLEQFFRGCLQLRAAAAMDFGPVSVARLTGLTKVKNVHPHISTSLKVELSIEELPVIHVMLSSSRHAGPECNGVFLQELKGVTVTRQQPIAIIVSAPGDAFDVAVKVSESV